MAKGILYANGVVSSLSQSLLTTEFYNRLLECPSVQEMYFVLQETCFGFEQEEMTINEKMQIETNKLVEFVKQESPDDNFTQFFLLFFDYENIETYVKCQILKDDPNLYIEAEGQFSFDQINSLILSKNYDGFKNPFIKKALEEFEKLSQNQSINGWEIDTIFKKYLYLNLQKIPNSITSALAKYLATIENISVATRAKTIFEFESQILNLGYLDKKQLISIFNHDKSALSLGVPREILSFVKLALNEKTKENVINFEKQRQSFAAKYFYARKDNIESISPFAYYVFRKYMDIKNIRLVFSYAENNLSQEIKKRILKSEK